MDDEVVEIREEHINQEDGSVLILWKRADGSIVHAFTYPQSLLVRVA